MAETLAAAHGRTAPRAPLTGGGALTERPGLLAPASRAPLETGGGGLTERLDRVAPHLARGGGLPLSLARA